MCVACWASQLSAGSASAFISINIYKQQPRADIVRFLFTFKVEFSGNKRRKKNCGEKKKSPVSVTLFIFKCQAAPVLPSSPFPQLANVQNWYLVFSDRLLWWKRYSEREEKKSEGEQSHGAFREPGPSSDVTPGPLAAKQTIYAEYKCGCHM